MIAKRGLGRGLTELLSEMNHDAGTNTTTNHAQNRDFLRLPIDLLQPGKYQPRKDMDHEALQELADSIRAQGIIQPIIARPLHQKPNHYEIIAGERRWRAAQLAHLTEVPVIVRDIPDEAAIAMALIENIQREDLNAIEEAVALQRLIDEFGMTHQDVANAVGKSRATVSNLLRLLALNNEVKLLVERGDLEMGHARTLLALQGSAQNEAAGMIVNKRLSVRETESLVKKWDARVLAKAQTAEKQNPDILHLQKELSDKIGARVNIQHLAKGQGKLVIQYNSLEQLEGILERIG